MNNTKKQIAALLVVVLLAISLCGCQTSIFPTMVREFDDDGSAILNTTLYDMNTRGLNVGKSVLVTVGDFSEVIPFVDVLIEEDGKLQLFTDNNSGTISIVIYNESFEEVYGIKCGDMVKIEKQ